MRLQSGSHSARESSLSHPHPPTYATSQVRLVPSYMGGGWGILLPHICGFTRNIIFSPESILWPGATAPAPDIALDITKNSNVDFIYKRVYLSFGLLHTSLLIFPLSHNLWATKPLSLSLSMSLSLHSSFSFPPKYFSARSYSSCSRHHSWYSNSPTKPPSCVQHWQQVSKYSNIQMFKYPNIQILLCTAPTAGFEIFKYPDV